MPPSIDRQSLRDLQPEVLELRTIELSVTETGHTFVALSGLCYKFVAKFVARF